jgi:hypothetical protein
LTSDHVKELTEEVEKLAKENVGEVRRMAEGEKEREKAIEGRRENVCTCMHVRVREGVCV